MESKELTTEDTPPVSTNIAVDFVLDEKSNVLSARLYRSAESQEFSIQLLREELSRKNFDTFKFRPDAIENLFSSIANYDLGSFEIADRVDSTMLIEISEDELHCFVTLAPAFGGIPISFDALKEQVAALGVVPDDEALQRLQKLCDEGGCERELWFSGRAAVPGQESKFEQLVKLKQNETPTIDEAGNADHKNTHDFHIVEPDTPLLRRTPAIEGVAGLKVSGEAIIPENIIDQGFESGMKGVKPDPQDENLLLAEIKGHPVYSKYGVSVLPFLTLPGVNIKSGNVNFDGTVMITGDVMPGFEVIASGDIIVHGIVEKAVLKAGNNITVHKGVIGNTPEDMESTDAEPPLIKDSDYLQDEEKEEEAKTRLIAEGSIECKFLNFAHAEAGTNVLVQEYIIQSQVKAEECVKIGEGLGKGLVVGGKLDAGKLISAQIVGSDANVKTRLSVGRLGEKNLLHKQLHAAFHDKADQLLSLSKTHKQLRNSMVTDGKLQDQQGQAEQEQQQKEQKEKKDRLAEISKTVKELRAEIDRDSDSMQELAEEIKSGEEAMIICHKQMYPNVQININQAELNVRTLIKHARFERVANKVQQSPLDQKA